MKAFLSAFALVAFASPALADKYIAVTPSGMAEMVFVEPTADAIGKLSSACIDRKWTVFSSSPTELICETQLSIGESLAASLAMGNQYSTPPRRFFKFTASNVGGLSRVQASGWVELQMAFGQMKRTDFAGPPFHNGAMQFMELAGGHFPLGTTFPNHVQVGFKLGNLGAGNKGGALITEVIPGSAAEKGGIMPNDVLKRVAGKSISDAGDLSDALEKATKTETYEVEVLRDGKPVKLVLDRRFRPEITAADMPKPRPTQAVAPMAVVAPTSVADELLKLSKLKEQGILTSEEFEAQKKKLLEGDK